MNRTTTLLLAVVVVVAAVPAVTAAERTQSDLVTVTVTVENEAGTAVGGAELTATWDGGNRTATTVSNGQALIDVPRGADVDISVQSDDYVRNTPYEVDNAGQESVTITVAEKGFATVRVLDRSGVPVNKAVVQLFHDGETVVNTRTNANGIYQTDAIEQGEYTLRALKERYFTNGTTVEVTGNTSVSTRIETGSVLVTFDVTDDHFDPARPVEGATVSIPKLGDTSQTLADGEATTSVPVNTNFEVEITKERYETVTEQLDVGEERTTLSATIQREEAITLTVSNSQIIVGENVTVDVENEYGTVVEGATVTVDGETVGETNANGELTFSIERSGVNAIRVESGDLSDSATVEGFSPDEGTPEDTATEVETTEDETTTSSGIGPGFTPVAAVVAALLAVLVLRRRA
ncbi:carboxypeptidase-like regulatory domain-containing protein [Halorientalis regularis]|jgi:PGF-CTERM protein|uniref:PGF-CTERM protein n=1 Tax=Halorientalis regularis TaxID=660518 RepID=A0A1G7PXD7_9EURY|nr:carboxypeptidase-like regulatory domain-containing protein [Halorientalis regularis]SDF90893.1 PGF-CTERM protein [Halorientalis regularis]